MTTPAPTCVTPVEEDSGDILTKFLIEYLQGNTPEGTLDEIYRVAGAARNAAAANGVAWTPNAQRRSLLEATGVVLGGGIETLTAIGRCVFDSIRSPERLETFRTLGSPAAVYEALPKFLEVYGPAFQMKTELIGTNECRIEIRMRDSNEPFRELCAFGLGLTSTVPPGSTPLTDSITTLRRS
jgi:hypothetical protein